MSRPLASKVEQVSNKGKVALEHESLVTDGPATCWDPFSTDLSRPCMSCGWRLLTTFVLDCFEVCFYLRSALEVRECFSTWPEFRHVNSLDYTDNASLGARAGQGHSCPLSSYRFSAVLQL